MTTTPANARDVGIEVAAHAMRNATDRAAVGMSMRGRRDLAALAYDAIRGTIAAELDEHRDRAEAANNLLANAEHHLTAAREELATTTSAFELASGELAKTRAELAALKVQYAGVQMERDLANEQLNGWRKRAANPEANPATTAEPAAREVTLAEAAQQARLNLIEAEQRRIAQAEPADEPKATCGSQYWGGLRQPGDRPILCTLPPHDEGDHEEPETESFWSREPRQWGYVATGDPRIVRRDDAEPAAS